MGDFWETLHPTPQIDEYGLEKPAKTHLESWTDVVAPDPNEPVSVWDIPGALAAAPLGVAGYVADSWSDFPYIGDLGHLRHGMKEQEYLRKRAEMEAMSPIPMGVPQSASDWPEGGECDPDAPQETQFVPTEGSEQPECNPDMPTPTYEWMCD